MQVTDLRVSWEEPAMESSGEVCCRRLHSTQTGPERNPFNISQSAGRKLAPVSSVEGPSVRWRWERLSEASRPSVLLTTDLKSQDSGRAYAGGETVSSIPPGTSTWWHSYFGCLKTRTRPGVITSIERLTPPSEIRVETPFPTLPPEGPTCLQNISSAHGTSPAHADTTEDVSLRCRQSQNSVSLGFQNQLPCRRIWSSQSHPHQ